MNKSWAKWIFATVSKYFFDRRNGIAFFTEGEDQKVQNETDYFEFRMNGPIFNEISKDYWKLEIVVNVLIVCKQNILSIHNIHTNVGIIASAFSKFIPIYKYGSDVLLDDDSFVGCMQLQKEISVFHIGQIHPDIKEMQATVEGYYCMYLET